MPMSLHRPALAAILVAFVAVLSLGLAAPARAVQPTPPMNPIASVALSYDGTYQGECWIFVKKVVKEATGREMGFDYRQGYFDAGAIEVSFDQAQMGDIIQIASDADTSPDASYSGLHTAIIVENLGDGIFNVVDSNRDFDGMVHQRSAYDPRAISARSGLNYHIYRITGGTPTIAPKLAAAAPPAPVVFRIGDHAITNTPGDVLNIRTSPNGSILPEFKFPDGTKVTITGEAVAAGAHTWVKVSSGLRDGWVASEYLVKDPAGPGSAAGAPAANGTPVRPVLAFHSFAVAIVSSDSN
jgi:hypothetical protein